MSKRIVKLLLLICWAYFRTCDSKIILNDMHEQSEHKIFNTIEAFSENTQPIPTRHGRYQRDTTNNQLQPNMTLKTFGQSQDLSQAVLHWSGSNHSGVIYMLLRRFSGINNATSQLHRSSDYGKTFSLVAPPEKNAVIQYFIWSRLNPKFMLFIDAGNRVIYKSLDEGATPMIRCGDKNHPLHFSPEKVILSPYTDQAILAYSYTERAVYVSEDQCDTWIRLVDNANSRIFWGDPKFDPPGTIHVEVEDIATDGYRYMNFSSPYDTTSAQDMTGVIDLDSLLVTNEYVFVQKSTQFETHLYVSYKRQEFRKAYFPLDQIPLDFRILSTDESQVFIAANHQQGHVNLYLSDVTGRFYTLSLPNVAAITYSSGFTADIYEVKGLKGIFLANQDTGRDGTRTLITFDKGGEWTTIKNPLDENNQALCKPNDDGCSLHLHLGISELYMSIQPPTSEPNAPGLIIAQGNAGSHLHSSGLWLFVSRDGGQSWVRSHEGRYHVNILDQGGALVAVNVSSFKQKTDKVLFTVDEGKSWQAAQFPAMLQVNGMLNEPGITTLITSVFGHDNTQGRGRWVVIRVDFSSVLTRKCNVTQDYETWTPSDHKGHTCLLGQHFTYSRQKQGSDCYNGEDFTHSKVPTTCTCSEEDYECDYGYGRKSDACTPLDWFDPKKPQGVCTMGGNYSKSSGYRKVPSDKCTGGDSSAKYEPVETECPVMPPGGLHLSVKEGLTLAVHGAGTFELQQDEGSKVGTTYSWNFGDDTETVERKTFMPEEKHSFARRGVYHVQMRAHNTAGSSVTSLNVLVEDKLRGIDMIGPHGVQVGVPVELTADVIANGDLFDEEAQNVHYVFDFGDSSVTKARPILTIKHTVSHIYSVAGNYTCTVQAVNALSNQILAFPVTVYGTLVTVRLKFTIDTYWLSIGSVIWNNQFARSVKNTVMAVLSLPPTRLEVVAISRAQSLQYVDVSILPNKQTKLYDPHIEEHANLLADLVNSAGLKIELDADDYGQDEEVKAIHAEILDHTKVKGKDSKNLTALYVSLPICLVMIALVVALVVMHYRRKSRLMSNRYRLLHSRSQQPDDAGDGLLEDDHVNPLDGDVIDDVITRDDDDDDVMLDAGGNVTSAAAAHAPQRLAINTGEDDDDDPLHVISGGSNA